MKPDEEPQLVLAIFTTKRGFGWVIFEGPHGLIDWGRREARGDKNRQSVAKVTKLINWYKPDVLVLEDAIAKHSRRRKRIQLLQQDLTEVASSFGIDTEHISRSEIKAVFEARGAKTRYGIAAAVAVEFPTLAPWMPPPRKIWREESPRLSIFDAAALAISFFELNKISDLHVRA
jgi:hypothetical protein